MCWVSQEVVRPATLEELLGAECWGSAGPVVILRLPWRDFVTLATAILRQPSQLYVRFRQRLVDFTVTNHCLVKPRNTR
jgi:hypothetical protein